MTERTSASRPIVAQTEVWAQLWLCAEDCARIRELLTDQAALKRSAVISNTGTFRDASSRQAVLTEHTHQPEAAPVYDARNHSLVLFDNGDEIAVQAGPEGIRFLLVS